MTDAAYASGLVNWEIDNYQPDPTGPILRFEFEAYGVTLGSTTRFIGGFNFHLTRIGDGLAGYIDANNTGNEVHLASLQYDGTLWRVNGANTDFGGCSNDACTGDLGRWQRAGQAGVPDAVPEPLSAALLGIRLLGLAAAARLTP